MISTNFGQVNGCIKKSKNQAYEYLFKNMTVLRNNKFEILWNILILNQKWYLVKKNSSNKYYLWWVIRVISLRIPNFVRFLHIYEIWVHYLHVRILRVGQTLNVTIQGPPLLQKGPARIRKGPPNMKILGYIFHFYHFNFEY